jgi:hypothetical protein
MANRWQPVAARAARPWPTAVARAIAEPSFLPVVMGGGELLARAAKVTHACQANAPLGPAGTGVATSADHGAATVRQSAPEWLPHCPALSGEAPSRSPRAPIRL